MKLPLLSASSYLEFNPIYFNCLFTYFYVSPDCETHKEEQCVILLSVLAPVTGLELGVEECLLGVVITSPESVSGSVSHV